MGFFLGIWPKKKFILIVYYTFNASYLAIAKTMLGENFIVLFVFYFNFNGLYYYIALGF